MLDAFPIYHWFHNGNPYSGAEGGMRYVITPIKVPDPSDESGKKKREALCAEVWPGPWSIEHTAEEKIETQLFDGDQAGLDKAVAWLHERYTAEADRWNHIVEGELVTKGDANAEPDPLKVEYAGVLGTVTAHIPFIGIYAGALNTLPGKLYAFGFIVAAAMLYLLAHELSE